MLSFLLLMGSVDAQDIPTVKARFAHPEFAADQGIYTVDVQLQADRPEQSLFGFNVRFFYDAEVMEFQEMSDFAPGYGRLGRTPRNHVGNPDSGTQLFNMPGAAAYINTAVQLFGEEDEAIDLQQEGWTTVFRLRFKVHDHVNKDADFCPSMIWDLMNPERSRGGILPNEDGIVFTVLEKNPATSQESAPSYSAAETFNWKYMNRETYPYGIPQAEQCISLSAVVDTDPGKLDEGYRVYQNEPNPFDAETFIRFDIPEATEVKLVIVDAAGRTLMERREQFHAGANAFRVTAENIQVNGATQMLFYHLQTDEFTSQVFKMNRTNQ